MIDAGSAGLLARPILIQSKSAIRCRFDQFAYTMTLFLRSDSFHRTGRLATEALIYGNRQKAIPRFNEKVPHRSDLF